MNRQTRFWTVVLNMLILTQTMGVAMTNQIKFDDKTYLLSNPDSKSKDYTYLLKNENIGNWHTKVTMTNIPDKTNKTEAAAEFAHKIQAENPGASVLVYPEAATIGYLTFPKSKEYYEYNTVVFQKTKNGLDKIGFAKRFYSSELNGQENARKSAIEFAEKNNKKYMEMLNKTAPKLKVE